MEYRESIKERDDKNNYSEISFKKMIQGNIYQEKCKKYLFLGKRNFFDINMFKIYLNKEYVEYQNIFLFYSLDEKKYYVVKKERLY